MSTAAAAQRLPSSLVPTTYRPGLPPHRSIRGAHPGPFAGEPTTARQTIRREPFGEWWIK